ncbi:MAG: WD40 repeat domain-containing protein [Thermoleophilia bacterium]
MRSTVTAGRSRRPQRGALVVAVAALVVGVPAGAGACGGSSSPAPAATVTVTVAPSASPSPSSTGAATAQLVVAVASGPKANGISVVNSTGKVKQLVAPSGGPVSDLSWAPDGVRLAFLRAVSASDSTSSLFVYNTRKALLYQVGAGVAPAAIDSYAWVGPTQLVESYFPVGATTYHANGTLYLRDIAKTAGQPVKDSSGHVVKGVGVSASADGAHVASVTYGAKSGGTIPESLRVYDTSNQSVSTVATREAPTQEDGDQFTYSRISPDGALIATLQTGSDIGFGCTVYGVDGAKRLQTGALVWPAPVSWTSHGPRLAFGGGPGSGSGERDSLLVWAAGGAKATPVVTGLKAPITSLAWTPKASQIAYAVARSNGLQSSLWIVDANGSNRHLLLADGSWPAWAVAPVGFP